MLCLITRPRRVSNILFAIELPIMKTSSVTRGFVLRLANISAVLLSFLSGMKASMGGHAVRLTEGEEHNEGYLEIYHNATWGKVCRTGPGYQAQHPHAVQTIENIDKRLSETVCSLLGFKDGDAFISSASPSGEQGAWRSSCKLSDTTLSKCVQRWEWDPHGCTHTPDERFLRVRCTNYEMQSAGNIHTQQNISVGSYQLMLLVIVGIFFLGLVKLRSNQRCKYRGVQETKCTTVSPVPTSPQEMLIQIQQMESTIDAYESGVMRSSEITDIDVIMINKGSLPAATPSSHQHGPMPIVTDSTTKHQDNNHMPDFIIGL